jgi:preprotein translocase subunit SecE
MGRAARRAQQKAERRQATQRRTAPPRPTRPQISPTSSEDGRRAGGSRFKPRWAMDVISELRKVTWPSRQETAHLTGVVLVVSLILGVVLGVADVGFSWLVEQTILR